MRCHRDRTAVFGICFYVTSTVTTVPTILVAHPQRSIRETLAACLRADRDVRVIKASNALDVLGLVGSRPIDAVLISSEFPDLDATDLLGWIRDNGPTRDLPVLIVEDVRDRHSRNAWIGAGAMAVVTLPFSVDALQSRIRSLLATRVSNRTPVTARESAAHDQRKLRHS